METLPVRKETGLQKVEKSHNRKSIAKLYVKDSHEQMVRLREENAVLERQYLDLLVVNNEQRNIIYELQKKLTEYQLQPLSMISQDTDEDKKTALPLNEKISECETNAGDSTNDIVLVQKQPEPVKPKVMDSHSIMKRIKGLTRSKKQHQATLKDKTHFLLALYRASEKGLRPDVLFSAVGLRRVTGFRYVSFFQKKGFLKFSGNNWEGSYYITDKGKKFLEGEDVDLKDVNSRYYKGKLEREKQEEHAREVRDRLDAVMQQKNAK